jgi:hypothetical protein
MSAAPQWSEILVLAFAGAGAGWFLAFFLNFVIFAPVKAYRVMNPFYLSISDTIMSPEFVNNDKTHRYNAALIIKKQIRLLFN